MVRVVLLDKDATEEFDGLNGDRQEFPTEVGPLLLVGTSRDDLERVVVERLGSDAYAFTSAQDEVFELWCRDELLEVSGFDGLSAQTHPG